MRSVAIPAHILREAGSEVAVFEETGKGIVPEVAAAHATFSIEALFGVSCDDTIDPSAPKAEDAFFSDVKPKLTISLTFLVDEVFIANFSESLV